MEQRFNWRHMPFVLGALSLLGALMLLLSAGAQSAKATEYQFCWGKKLPGFESGCKGPQRYYSAVYANADKAGVCLFAWEALSGCLKNPNEGVYDNYGDGYGHLSQPQIINWSLAGVTATVYGIGWDGPPPPASPPPPPPPATQYRYQLGTSNGNGIASWNSVLSGMSQPQRMRLEDFSGDGKADVVALESEGNGKYRYMVGMSNGSGVSSWSQVLDGMSDVKGMNVADFTGDGKADIVAAESASGSYRYMVGTSNGSGIAGWNQVIGGMSEPKAMGAGDFTGDGKADIVVIESEGNGKYRYMVGKSNGSGIASWTQVMSGMSEVRGMSIGDFSGDGKADIIAMEPEGNGKYRYMVGKSNGSGIASWTQVMSGMSDVKALSIGDFSGDGRADIVAVEAAGTGHRYMVGTSNGSGIASWTQVMSGMSLPKGFSVGDLTGDGKADVVAIEEE